MGSLNRSGEALVPGASSWHLQPNIHQQDNHDKEHNAGTLKLAGELSQQKAEEGRWQRKSLRVGGFGGGGGSAGK